MKKWKGRLMQGIMAALLAAVMCIGMASLTAPVKAMAESNTSGEVTLTPTIYWCVTDDNELIISDKEADTSAGSLKGNFTGDTRFWQGQTNAHWRQKSAEITKVTVKGTVVPEYTQYWFSSFSVCTSMDLSGLDTSKVVDMSSMFVSCKSLETLDLSNFNTSNVTNMWQMFYGCNKMTEVKLANFDTAKVTKMSSMFKDCKALTTLDVSNFNTANVTDMSSMFENCKALTTLDISNFDTAKVTNMSKIFFYCQELTELNVRNFDTSQAKTMQQMFSGCSKLTELDVSSFNTTNVTDMSAMFSGCQNLTSLDVSNFNTANVKLMASMFSGCKSLISLDISNFNTSKVTSMSNMFYECEKILSLDLTNFDTANVTSMSNMFRFCTVLNDLNVSGFDTSKVTNMSYMFSSCKALENLNISNFNTAEVTNMWAMFYNCESLLSLDIPNINTAKVTNMSDMFRNCKALTSLDISNFDTAKVTKMDNMFSGCESLPSLDISNFNTIEVLNMRYMFYNCKALETLTLSADKFNTAKVTAMEYMFSKCISLTELDLSGFDTAKVTNMDSMFDGCAALGTLNLSSFNTDKVTSMWSMLARCGMDSITISDSFAAALGKYNTGMGTLYVIKNPCSAEKYPAVGGTIAGLSAGKYYTKFTPVHDYNVNAEPKWTWTKNADGSYTVSAEFTCTNDSTHKQVMEAAVTLIGEVAPNCTTDGYNEYSAELVFNSKSYSNIKKDTLNAKGHTYRDEWKRDSADHWKECEVCRTDSEHISHIYDSSRDMICNTCDYNRASLDTQAPMGSIVIGSNSWTSLLNNIAFEIFFKEEQQATINAEDTGFGVDQIYYYISDNALTEAQIKGLADNVWTAGNSVSINPEGKYVVYAKITDVAGNITYISSNGLVFDKTAPVISGVTDGETYRKPQTVTVTDDNVESVKVNGTIVTLENNEFTLTASSERQTIVVTDKAGNTAEVTVTVKTEAENVADAKKAVEDALADITVANDTKKEDLKNIIEEALTKAGIPDVTVKVGDFTKTEATNKDTGSIIGSVEIVSNIDDTVKDSVAIDKAIEKLPYTDAEKVADAKKAVEDALADITVTNDTKKEDLENVIQEALTKAGITDVTVTVGDFTKTEATEENEGSINTSVEIVSNNDNAVKDSVSVDKTIEKLPSTKTEAEKVAEAKEAVENALADITVTNDTKKEDLKKEIEEALTKAGITDVTVTVGELTKTEATEENEGSIRASVEIVSKKDDTVKDSISLEKTIAKLPAGKIETDKEQGANTPVTEFGDSKDSIIDAVLTPEDKNLVEDGKDIKIILTVDNIDASVAEADKQDIAEKIAENTETETYEVGEYLDINLYKLIGADRTKVSHTSGKIKIVIEVPDSLKNADSNKTRSYAVVRVHEGVAEILPDIDNDAATITIETDLFSTYAIVYKDSVIGGSGDNTGDDGGDNNPDKPNTSDGDNTSGSGTDKPNASDSPNTGDTTPIRIYAILAMAAGFTYLSLLFGKRKRTKTE